MVFDSRRELSLNNKILIIALIVSLSTIGFSECIAQQNNATERDQAEYIWSKVLDSVNPIELVAVEKIDALTWEEKCFSAVEVALKEFDKRIIKDDELDHLFEQFGKHGDRADLVWYCVVSPMLFELNFDYSPGKNMLANCDKFRAKTIQMLSSDRDRAIRFHQFYVWSTYARISGLGTSQDFDSLMTEYGECHREAEKLKEAGRVENSELLNLNLRMLLFLVALEEFDLINKHCPETVSRESTIDFIEAYYKQVNVKWLVKGMFSIYLDPETRTWKRSCFKVSMFQLSLLFNVQQWMDVNDLVDNFSVTDYWGGYGKVFRSTYRRYTLPVRGWKDDELNYQLVQSVAGYYDEIWDKK